MPGRLLWRGSLLPLGCVAVVESESRFFQVQLLNLVATASRSSGSKLPRHKCAVKPLDSCGRTGKSRVRLLGPAQPAQ
ncbi:hypothetical protein C1Y08_06260 [Pseudomonas sp. FW306-02-F02-AA]|nr:hypothetical protein C1Y07_25505 [Pseudomonas sp. FW306-02-F02-AB]PMZ09881.1 hypothetical protein C1Y06_11280 [Pseudomonas sp. FW306-02-H06C]PMZ16813.1 hypothetical protein C1Y08_06260 [Pseudomonas sp. FW306-02-F02-AA]PMZ23742.1 hypothetical protein C1Y09_02835 [Pseudomonas sp. FW306-02-F08-AA]PMZ28612.1 hypothetical protein C1Y05_07085 [Pseudomonas sp. FW306-02-F04-BA]PMZ33792.1 hypothetical protein C1X99_14960 [Pseudomonas sp. FW306-02-H06B]PMZ42211.1 hypothetical protein C1Y00_03470 [Ps